jgi:hypothetical protein
MAAMAAAEAALAAEAAAAAGENAEGCLDLLCLGSIWGLSVWKIKLSRAVSGVQPGGKERVSPYWPAAWLVLWVITSKMWYSG